MDNSANNKFQVTKGSSVLRLREILMDSDGLLTLVKLNFFFIITTIPVLPFIILFTGGGAITALLYCTNQLVRTGSVSQVRKTYFDVFKKYFKRTFFPGLAVILLTFVFTAGLIIYLTLASSNVMYIPFASVSLLVLIFIWSTAIHLFPAFTESRNETKSTKELLSVAISTVFEKMKKTVIAVIVSIFTIAGIFLMLPKTLPLMLVIMFSVPGLAAGFAHSDAEFISDII
ncbi:MAG: DUF624 domain-containing protein [Oscillospiraceae bacterium]|nr:DUF624 domain-containing protein [Oscillospiraceae bacterium]